MMDKNIFLYPADKYIHYLWVRNIDKMDGDKIYIPTEANMPILESKEQIVIEKEE